MMTKAFPLAWRFTNPAYAAFDKSELEEMEPIDDQTATEMWKSLVDPIYDHPMQVPAADAREVIARFPINSDDPDAGRGALGSHLPGDDKTTLLIFWGPLLAVQCPRGLFLKHWTDFLYPSDENSVVVDPSAAVRLVHVNELCSVERIEPADER